MNTVLVMDDKLECWLVDNIPPEILSVPLPDEVADKVVEHLKQEADRYWAINTERSLELARRIIAIGNARNDEAQAALGWMARGDALRFSGQMEEAWETLELAGKMFNTARDKVGWARTRIGRLYLAVKLNHVKETLVDGKEAQKIFRSNRKYELMVRLNMARAVVYGSLGNAHRALRLLRSAITLAETLGTTGEKHLGVLYMNLGLAHEVLGDFSRALTYYERARSICIARNETRNIALIEINIAYIAQAQGHYRRSLELLHDMLEQGLDQFPMECLAVKRDMTECYIYLNRYNDACDLALQVVDGYRRFGSAYEIARSLLHQATAEAESGNFLVAHARLEEAGRIFANLGATSWEATTRLRRGRIALKQDNHTAAFQEADAAAADFKSSGQRVNYAAALMLKGQALFASENFDEAAKAGVNALQIAQHYNVPSLRYTSHLLLGKIAEARSEIQRAVRRYQAAASTIERVQRGLTITLRPGFLEDKGEASRALIGLYLQAGQTDKAFETVERVKSQVLLGYLLNREHLRWTQDTPQSRLLVDELNRLRAEHQWFHRLAYDPPRRAERPSSISREQALAEISVRERRMRAITEQLYLHSGNGQQANRVPTTSLNDIQHVLDHDTLLIEFYNDGGNVWAFILEHGAIEVHRLPLTVGTLNQMLAQLQTNLSAALSVAPQTPAGLGINQLAQRILRRLYALLVEPLALDRRNPQRLVIVPYGALHYLPFNLLFDGSTYLIEKFEIVILPTASLATRPGPRRKPGALILAHSLEGRLPHTLAEARMVQQLFGGARYIEEGACREILQAPPRQILHIAAHGQHRLDQPDLSYLHLADGQMYADDLLQQDLSYELVTLSACETGLANVAASDELIGLGRGFLYAGAGALLVSLWRVTDDSTLEFMKRMYMNLHNGKKSKAAAFREAQSSLIAENRQNHPAFWGAFQLMGNADPLSISIE